LLRRRLRPPIVLKPTRWRSLLSLTPRITASIKSPARRAARSGAHS